MRLSRASQVIRRAAYAVPFLVCAALTSCESGGHFTILGYSSRPNYDPCIKTIYVPIFENKTFWRGLEFDLTKAVIREIEAKTPFKVVNDRARADTILTGSIGSFQKMVINRNQLNEIREAETVLTAAVVWQDLRSGEVLSQPKPKPTGPVFAPLPEIGSGGTPDAPPNSPARPVMVTSLGNYIPEIGQSTTTAIQQNVNRLAVQIVSVMEKPW